MTHEALAELLNRYPEVRWDRMAYGNWPPDDADLPDPDPMDYGVAYGWIDRDDGRSDFLLISWVGGEAPSMTTSSAEWSREFDRRFRGTDEGHHDCERIEDVLGDLVPTAIRLERPPPTASPFKVPQLQEIGRSLPPELRTRVWRERFGEWWAELWRAKTPDDPPSLFPRPTPTPPQPYPIDGYVRVGLALRHSRRKARKEAKRMHARYVAGLHPEKDRAPVEDSSRPGYASEEAIRQVEVEMGDRAEYECPEGYGADCRHPICRTMYASRDRVAS